MFQFGFFKSIIGKITQFAHSGLLLDTAAMPEQSDISPTIGGVVGSTQKMSTKSESSGSIDRSGGVTTSGAVPADPGFVVTNTSTLESSSSGQKRKKQKKHSKKGSMGLSTKESSQSTKIKEKKRSNKMNSTAAAGGGGGEGPGHTSFAVTGNLSAGAFSASTGGASSRPNSIRAGEKPSVPTGTGSNNDTSTGRSISIDIGSESYNNLKSSNGQHHSNLSHSGNGFSTNAVSTPVIVQTNQTSLLPAGAVRRNEATAATAVTRDATATTTANAGPSGIQKLHDAAAAELKQGHTTRAVQLMQQASSISGSHAPATSTNAPLLLASPTLSFTLQQQAAALVHSRVASNINQALHMIQQGKVNINASSKATHSSIGNGVSTESMNRSSSARENIPTDTNTGSRKRKTTSASSSPQPQDRQSSNDLSAPNKKRKKAKVDRAQGVDILVHNTQQKINNESLSKESAATSTVPRGGFFINGVRAEKDGGKLIVNGASKSSRGRKRSKTSVADSSNSRGRGRPRKDNRLHYEQQLQQQQLQQRQQQKQQFQQQAQPQQQQQQQQQQSIQNNSSLQRRLVPPSQQLRPPPMNDNQVICIDSDEEVKTQQEVETNNDKTMNGNHHDYRNSNSRGSASSKQQEHNESIKGSSNNSNSFSGSAMASSTIYPAAISTATNMFLPPSPVAPQRKLSHPHNGAGNHQQNQHLLPPSHRLPNPSFASSTAARGSTATVATSLVPPPQYPIAPPFQQQQQQQQQQHTNHLQQRRYEQHQQQRQQQFWLHQQRSAAAMRNFMSISTAPAMAPRRSTNQNGENQTNTEDEGGRATFSAPHASGTANTGNEQEQRQQQIQPMAHPNSRAQLAISFLRGIADGKEEAFTFFDGGKEEAVKHATANLVNAVVDIAIPIPTTGSDNANASSPTTNENSTINNFDLSSSSKNVTLSLIQLENVARSSVSYHRKLTSKFLQRALNEMIVYHGDIERKMRYNDQARLCNLNKEYERAVKEEKQHLKQKYEAKLQRYITKYKTAELTTTRTTKAQHKQDLTEQGNNDVQQEQTQIRTVTLEEENALDENDKKQKADPEPEPLVNGEMTNLNVKDATKVSPDTELQKETNNNANEYNIIGASTEESTAKAASATERATMVLEVSRLKEEAEKEKAQLVAQHQQLLEEKEMEHNKLLSDKAKMYKDENDALKKELEELKRKATQMNEQYRIASTQAFRLWRKDPT